MAQTAVVYSGLAQDATVQGDLFKGLRFWVAIRVPMRSTYVQNILGNGGTVVKLEKDADILIADHLRPEAPPGSYSYRWVEACMRAENLVDKEAHRAGPRAVAARPVGAIKPAKQGRAKYSREDDVELFHWVKDHESRGGKVLGNDIYKQLEEKNPRHPWQSWRDRYVKYICNRPASDFIQGSPPTPPAEEPAADSGSTLPAAGVPDVPAQTQQDSSVASVHFKPSVEEVTTYDNTLDELDISQNQNISQPNTVAAFFSKSSSTNPDVVAVSGPPRRVQGQRSVIYNKESNPLPKDFRGIRQADFDELYEKVQKIQNYTVEAYEKIWLELDNYRPEATSEDWREYYEVYVLPKWKYDHRAEPSIDGRSSRSESISEHFDDATEHQAAEDEGDLDPHNDRLEQKNTPKRRLHPVVVIEKPTKSISELDASAVPLGHASVDKGKRKATDQPDSNSRKRQHVEDASTTASGQPNTRQPTIAPTVDVINLIDDEDDLATIDRGNPVVQMSSHPAFEVYETHDIPEGEKENFNGSSTPKIRHPHVKSEAALQVFTDPPSGGFMLQAPETPVEVGENPDLDQDGWELINRPEQGVEDRNLGEIPVEDADVDTAGDILDELRSEYESRHQDDESDGDASRDWEAAVEDLDTQAILDAETQPPDLDVPLPPDESDNENDNSAQHFGNSYNFDEFTDYVAGNLDLEVPPPDMGSQLDEDYGAFVMEDDAPQDDVSAGESEIPKPRLKDRNALSRTTHQDQIRLFSSSPHQAEQIPESLTNTLAKDHPTVSTIRLRVDAQTIPSSPPRAPSPVQAPRSVGTPSPTHRPTARVSSTSSRTSQIGLPAPATATSGSQIHTLLTSFITSHTQQGYTPARILYALQRTNLDGVLAERVLSSIEKDGGAVPDNVRGIWTEEDDKVMQGGDAREMARLERKHGVEGYRMRLQMAGVWGII